MRNQKLTIITFIVGVLLVVIGLSVAIYLYINKNNEESKKIEENIIQEYEVFKTSAEAFNDFRTGTYYNEVAKNLYLESVEEEYENWITILQSYTNTIDQVEFSSDYLKENCVNKYYSNEEVKNKCDAFVIAYETAMNYYTKDIISFNEIIESYLNSLETANENIKTYDLKYNYIDINLDGKFIGRD